jgi:hypothetical protein
MEKPREISLNIKINKRNGNVKTKLMKLHITATIGIISGIKPGWLISSLLLVIQFEAWNSDA